MKTVAVFLFLLVISISEINAQVIFEDNFESGKFGKDKWNITWWTGKELPEGIEPEYVTSPVRAGKYAVKIRAEYNWNGIKDYNRTELQAKRLDTGNHFNFFNVHSKEYWIGFSVFIPNDWAIDSQPELIFQLHGNGGGRTPPFALYMMGDQWEWINRWQPDSSKINSVAGEVSLWKGTFEKGKWVDWVIHAVWSYKEDGFLEIIKDSKILVKRNGPNCYNDACGMRGPQTGIYKWPWREVGPSDVKERTIYLDEFKIVGAKGSYCDVAPNGGIR